MVTDFVEHIDDAVDTLERVQDFRRGHFANPHLKVHRQNLATLRQGVLCDSRAAVALYEQLDAALAPGRCIAGNRIAD
jgi:hypothetical protein